MALENLSTEVLEMCLMEMTCPEDLSAAIRASPVLLGVFIGHKDKIVPAVLRNCMSPQTLEVAVKLLTCPLWEPGDSIAYYDATVRRAKRKKTLWHLKLTSRDRNGRECRKTTLDNHAISVCRLRSRINSLIADYVVFTNSVAESDRPEPAICSVDQSILSELTPAEVSRLQHAFMRYEWLCRSYGWSSFHAWVETGEENTNLNIKTALSELPRCEAEALTVLHRFVVSKYTSMFKEIVDDFTTAVNVAAKSTGQPTQSAANSNLVRVHDLLGEDGPSYLLPVGWRAPTITDTRNDGYPEGTNQGSVGVCCDNLSRLGLGVLLSLMKESRSARKELLLDIFEVFTPRTTYPNYRSNFLQKLNDAEWKIGKEERSRDMENGSSGWCAMLEEESDNEQMPNSDRFADATLCYRSGIAIDKWRKIGWLFWDYRRLDSFGFFKEKHRGTLDGKPCVVDCLAETFETRPLYHEIRALAPMLPALRIKLTQEDWEKAIVPHFFTMACTKPRLEAKFASRNALAIRDKHERTLQMLEYAQNVALDSL